MTSYSRLVLGTSNAGKSAEFHRLLAHEPWHISDLSEATNPPQITEAGESYAENARLKATVVSHALGVWTLADDTGLEVSVLGGAPGIRTARFAHPNASAAENRQHLLARLEDVPLSQRTARFVCHLALADPSGDVRAEATGDCYGRVLFQESGSGGFGYDSLLEIAEYHCTLADLGVAATACLSHRARAVHKIMPVMRRLLQSENVTPRLHGCRSGATADPGPCAASR
jgi:XTP/dITP diphosphohydrolase